MLPAWVPLAEDGAIPGHWGPEAPPDRADGSAAASMISDEEDDAAAGPRQAASHGIAGREGWGTRTDRPPALPPSSAGGDPGAPDDDDASTEELAGGPADAPGAPDEPPTGGAAPSAGTYPHHGCHVLVAAPLWPRLCEADPDLPAELLRAGVLVHVVAEFTKVRTVTQPPRPILDILLLFPHAQSSHPAATMTPTAVLTRLRP